MKSRLSPRLALVIITLIFILPLAAAWLMYSGVIELQPVSTKNLGQLVQPPVPVDRELLTAVAGSPHPAGELDQHWGIVHDLPAVCADECLQAVTALRQVHRAAGRNQSRLRIVIVMPETRSAELEQNLRAIYPAFILAADPGGQFGAALQQIAAGLSPGSNGKGNTYLLDPLGNIMMFYEAGSDPNNLKKDLKRLLTWSKLDEQ